MTRALQTRHRTSAGTIHLTDEFQPCVNHALTLLLRTVAPASSICKQDVPGSSHSSWSIVKILCWLNLHEAMPLESAIFEDWVFSKCVNNWIFWVSQVDLSSRQVYYWFRETRRGESGWWQGRGCLTREMRVRDRHNSTHLKRHLNLAIRFGITNRNVD